MNENNENSFYNLDITNKGRIETKSNQGDYRIEVAKFDDTQSVRNETGVVINEESFIRKVNRSLYSRIEGEDEELEVEETIINYKSNDENKNENKDENKMKKENEIVIEKSKANRKYLHIESDLFSMDVNDSQAEVCNLLIYPIEKYENKNVTKNNNSIVEEETINKTSKEDSKSNNKEDNEYILKINQVSSPPKNIQNSNSHLPSTNLLLTKPSQAHKITKVKLLRTKESYSDKVFKNEVYIEGNIEIYEDAYSGDENKNNKDDELIRSTNTKIKPKKINKPFVYIPLENFTKENFLFSKHISIENPSGDAGYSKEQAIGEVCSFFSRLFKLSNLLLEGYNTFIKPVHLDTLFIFTIFNQITELNCSDFETNEENYIQNLIKQISLPSLIENIPKYIKFLILNFNKPIIKEFSENFTENLGIDKTKIESLKRFSIHSDVSTIINEFFNLFLLKWRDTTVIDKLKENAIETGLQSNYFYILLIKIENYFKHFFPYCCGTVNEYSNQLFYAKSPFVFCQDCKMIICVKCFKYHETHNYYDFSNFMKLKNKNISSPLTKFLNYQDADHYKKKDIDNNTEDTIMNNILSKFDSKIHLFFTQGKSDQSILANKKFFSVFDFMEIFLLEHLYKLVFPFQIDLSEVFKGKEEFNYIKDKLSSDGKLVKSISNAIIKMLRRMFKEIGEVDLKKLRLEEYYKNVIDEYTLTKKIKENEKKNNRLIVEDFYFNKISTELNTTKHLIISNQDLNYEVQSDNFALFISQVNSPKQIYSKFFGNEIHKKIIKSEDIKNQDEDNNNGNFQKKNSNNNNEKNAKYNKLMFDFSEMFRIEGNDFSSKFDLKKKIKNVIGDEKKSFLGGIMNLVKKKDFGNEKNNNEVFNINEIIPKALSINHIPQSYYSESFGALINSNSNSNSEIRNATRINYKDGYCSKFDLVSFYIENLLNKLNNYGSLKYKNK